MLKNAKDFYDASLNERNIVTTVLSRIEQKTGIRKRTSLAVILVVTGLYLLYGSGASVLCNLIGFAYPAHFSIKAIEGLKKDDAKQWLVYWVVFGIFGICETVGLSQVTFYYAGKCVFLLWCMAPLSWNGSTILYKSVIRPVFLKYQFIMAIVVNNLDIAEAVHKEANYDNKEE